MDFDFYFSRVFRVVILGSNVCGCVRICVFRVWVFEFRFGVVVIFDFVIYK